MDKGINTQVQKNFETTIIIYNAAHVGLFLTCALLEYNYLG
jgi:hypothetical protein